MDRIEHSQGHYKETIYVLLLSPQEFLVLTWSTLEGWKVKSALEPASGFENSFYCVIGYYLIGPWSILLLKRYLVNNPVRFIRQEPNLLLLRASLYKFGTLQVLYFPF